MGTFSIPPMAERAIASENVPFFPLLAVTLEAWSLGGR
jgi:hypothetical protein